MQIRYANMIGNPASLDRSEGILYLGPEFYKQPKPIQDFILEHEMGHYNLQTRNEMQADEYASNQLLGKQPGSLKNSIRALNNVLSFKNPEHYARLNAQTKRALLYDWQKYGNIKSKNILDNMTNKNRVNYDGNIDVNSILLYDNLFPSHQCQPQTETQTIPAKTGTISVNSLFDTSKLKVNPPAADALATASNPVEMFTETMEEHKKKLNRMWWTIGFTAALIVWLIYKLNKRST